MALMRMTVRQALDVPLPPAHADPAPLDQRLALERVIPGLEVEYVDVAMPEATPERKGTIASALNGLLCGDSCCLQILERPTCHRQSWSICADPMPIFSGLVHHCPA